MGVGADSWGFTSVWLTWPPHYVSIWCYCRLIIETIVKLREDSHLTADCSGRSRDATDARRGDSRLSRVAKRLGILLPYLQPKPDEDCLPRLCSSCSARDTGRRSSRDCLLRTGSSVLGRRVHRRNWHTPNVPYLGDKIVCFCSICKLLFNSYAYA